MIFLLLSLALGSGLLFLFQRPFLSQGVVFFVFLSLVIGATTIILWVGLIIQLYLLF